MKKYRQKPILVEAIQWFLGVEIEDVLEKGIDGEIITYFDGKGVLQQGACLFGENDRISLVKQGQWILQEEDGRRYICDDDFFKKYFDCLEEGILNDPQPI